MQFITLPHNESRESDDVALELTCISTKEFLTFSQQSLKRVIVITGNEGWVGVTPAHVALNKQATYCLRSFDLFSPSETCKYSIEFVRNTAFSITEKHNLHTCIKNISFLWVGTHLCLLRKQIYVYVNCPTDKILIYHCIMHNNCENSLVLDVQESFNTMSSDS